MKASASAGVHYFFSQPQLPREIIPERIDRRGPFFGRKQKVHKRDGIVPLSFMVRLTIRSPSSCKVICCRVYAFISSEPPSSSSASTSSSSSQESLTNRPGFKVEVFGSRLRPLDLFRYFLMWKNKITR